MVGIECTRCHSTGTGYPNLFQAKFTLVHKIGCGAKIGVPKYFTEKKPTEIEIPKVIEKIETKMTFEKKLKKRKAKKKLD